MDHKNGFASVVGLPQVKSHAQALRFTNGATITVILQPRQIFLLVADTREAGPRKSLLPGGTSWLFGAVRTVADKNVPRDAVI